MNERPFYRCIGLAALAVVALTAAGAVDTGAAEAPAAGASVEPGGGLVTFRSPTSDDFVLVVAGDGYRSRARFAGGQTAVFTPVDKRGFSLPDGLYKWEIIMTPELPTAAAPLQGKPADGRAAHRVPAPQRGRRSGAFSIANGSVVDSSLVEAPSPSLAGKRADSTNAATAARYDDSDAAALDGR